MSPALAAGALATLAYIEPRRADPLIEFRLFRSASFSAAILAVSAYQGPAQWGHG